MKFSLKQFLVAVILAAAFFFAGLYIFPYVYKWMIPQSSGAIYNITNFESPFNQAKVFAFILAAVPLLCWFIWNYLQVKENSKRLISFGLIFIGMVIAIAGRKLFLQNELSDVVKTSEVLQFNPQINKVFEKINMEYWMLVGLLTGAVISFIAFRKKKKQWKK